MKQFKKLILSMFMILSTGLYANTVNMAPIISYLLSDTTQVDLKPAPLPANITIDNAVLQKVIASVFDDTPYSPAIDIQGVIDSGGLTVSVPYTVVNDPVILPAYSTLVTLDALVTEDDEAGIVATFSWTEQEDLPVGSGFFIATITIDDSAGNADGIYNAKQLDIQDDSAGLVATTFPYATDSTGGTGTLTLNIMPGIADRMFGLPDNNGDDATHEFLYLSVTNTTTGKTWLSNNLGANYANMNSPVFDIMQQATASNDHNAYGSLFQWGRKADGHEFITWTNGTTGVGTNGTTATNSDDPINALFIVEGGYPYDWRVYQDSTLWVSESSINNVCPVGYRVPTGGELDSERGSWKSNNSGGALTGTLSIPVPGRRYSGGPNGGKLTYVGERGHYWGSTISGTYSEVLLFYPTGASMSAYARASGMSVRCIKD